MIRLVLGLLLMVICFAKLALAEELTFSKQILKINGVLLKVEVADTVAKRSQGLMGRTNLAKGEGMLFTFAKDALPCFWMKNTYLPLSLAYINKDQQIVQLEKLYPEDTSYICANQPIRYALEVPQGWFAEQAIEVGMQVEGINHSLAQ